MNKILPLLFALLLLTACQNSPAYRAIRGERIPSSPSPPETAPPGITAPETQPIPSTNPLQEQLKHYLQNPPMSKVTYRVQTLIREEKPDDKTPQEPLRFTGTQTTALQGKDLQLRTETTLQGKTLLTANYVLSGHYYTCQKQDQWMCYQLPQPPEDQTRQAQQAILEDLNKLPIQDAGSRTFLNTPTTCYLLLFEDPESQEKGQTTYCYEKSGILLYSHTQTPHFENTLEATHSTQPTAEDFQLPAEAQPLPTEEQAQS